MTRRSLPVRLAFILILCWPGVAAHAAGFDVKAQGALGDGKTLDTAAMNKAVSAAAAAGGGI